MAENVTISDIKDEKTVSEKKASLQVSIELLDTLMNLAGELVLCRNQLLQGVNTSNLQSTSLSTQRIDIITSELQEAIMRTRMQPISNVFGTFKRTVRDLSRQLNKTIDLTVEGKDVELDKTILESISSPLSYLICHCVENGIETPGERLKCGKEPNGSLNLKAYHDAGQVNIVISDDGKGLDPNKISETAVSKGLVTKEKVLELSGKQQLALIFLPGISKALENMPNPELVSGMDEVLATMERLGGVIELESTPGMGTTLQIRLPLTLAIVPSQIIAVTEERYAIPQINLNELLRIPAGQVKDKIEKVGDSAVVRLRGELLPLVDLADILGMDKTYLDPVSNDIFTDRRTNIADRRSKQHYQSKNMIDPEDEADNHEHRIRIQTERRYRSASAVNVAVVASGGFKYGLVVDHLHDSEEIVVKPVGRHIKECTAFGGATIMGDGKVALILDILAIAHIAKLSTVSEEAKMITQIENDSALSKETVALLTFKNSDREHFAVPLNSVERIERVPTSVIENIGDRKVIQYRGGALPLCEISQLGDFSPLPSTEQQEVIVFKVKGREFGLMVAPPIDTKDVVMDIDEKTLKQNAIDGSIVINDHTTLLINVMEMTTLFRTS